MWSSHRPTPPLATGLPGESMKARRDSTTLPARGNDNASATPPLVAKLPRYAARKANGSSSHFIAIFLSFIAIKWCCQDMELSAASTPVGGTQGHHATGNGVLWRVLAEGLLVMSVGVENIDVATLWSLAISSKNVGSCGVGHLSLTFCSALASRITPTNCTNNSRTSSTRNGSSSSSPSPSTASRPARSKRLPNPA